jgi:hypothetical protein
MNACLAAGQDPEDVCRELKNIGPVNAAQIDLGAGPWLIPMHGMYAFVVVFPMMLVMSIAYQRYSGLLDVLMVLAPERYRNHILLRKLALKSKPITQPSSKRQSSGGGWLDSMLNTEFQEPTMGNASYLEILSKDTKLSPEDFSFQQDEPKSNLDLEIIDLEIIDLDDQRAHDAPVMDITEVQLMANNAMGLHGDGDHHVKRSDLRDSNGQLTMTIERDPALTDFIDSLDKQMKRWKLIATSITMFLMVAGLLLALLFVGSFDPEGQEDWIKGVGRELAVLCMISPYQLFHGLDLQGLLLFLVPSSHRH